MTTPEPGSTVWGYSESDQAETWMGMCATREAAIAEALAVLDPAAEVWIVSGTMFDPASAVPDADRIIEWMGEQAGDQCGDVADEWPDSVVSDEAKANLTAMLKAWATQYAPTTFWSADGKAEKVLVVS